MITSNTNSQCLLTSPISWSVWDHAGQVRDVFIFLSTCYADLKMYFTFVVNGPCEILIGKGVQVVIPGRIYEKKGSGSGENGYMYVYMMKHCMSKRSIEHVLNNSNFKNRATDKNAKKQ